MKRHILSFVIAVAASFLCGTSIAAPAPDQERTTMATLYPEFKSSVIYLADGRKLNQSLTNVFLKNSSLVYLKGTYTMEANMDNIARVEFDDRQFDVIEKQLAELVDSVGDNAVYRVDYLDMDAYQRQLKNNINISNISLGDQISTSTVDLNNEEDYKFPLVHKYYMRYGGETFNVHEREIWRRLPKDKDVRRMFKTIISQPDFSWTRDESVSQLLRAIISVNKAE